MKMWKAILSYDLTLFLRRQNSMKESWTFVGFRGLVKTIRMSRPHAGRVRM